MLERLPERKLWLAVIERAIDDIADPRPLSVNRADIPYTRATAYEFLYERRRDLFLYARMAGIEMFVRLCAWLDMWRDCALIAIEEHGPSTFASWTPWRKSAARAAFRSYCPDPGRATLIPHLAQICVMERKWPALRRKSSS